MALTEKQFEANKAAVMRTHGLSEAQYDNNPGEAFEGEREYLLRPKSSVPWGFLIFGALCVLAALGVS